MDNSETVPRILVGPILRYVDATQATVWIETSAPCTVHISSVADPEPHAAHEASTFSASATTWDVFGHHFALVRIESLTPGTCTQYRVELTADGTTTAVWPENPDRPSVIRTLGDDSTLRLSFGSCRRGEAQSPRMLRKIGADALVALAHKMADTDYELWPDAMLLLGDQIYADIPSKAIAERLAKRRKAGGGSQSVRDSAGAKGDRDVSQEICDFEEYSWLYAESWRDPDVRWLMSTVPSCMILDDHDLRDDWNSSFSWRRDMTAMPWWEDRVIGAFSSYFVYQHLGNLAPEDLDADPTYQRLLTSTSAHERETLLSELAVTTDASPGASRWSYHRDFGRTRVVMLDVRASRHLDPRDRQVMDPREWQWVRSTCLEADVDHLVIGSSLPAFMVPALHHIEGWNEQIANYNNPNKVIVRFGEWVRRVVDLEHWAAFRRSFDALIALLGEISRGQGASTPASILVLGGDVHCSYLEEVQLTGQSAESDTEIHQLVMSPYRNPLHRPIRVVNQLARLRPIVAAMRLLASSVGVRDPEVKWRITDGIWFHNGVMTLVLDGRTASVEVDHASVQWPLRGLGILSTVLPRWLLGGVRAVAQRAGGTPRNAVQQQPRQVLQRTLVKRLTR